MVCGGSSDCTLGVFCFLEFWRRGKQFGAWKYGDWCSQRVIRRAARIILTPMMMVLINRLMYKAFSDTWYFRKTSCDRVSEFCRAARLRLFLFFYHQNDVNDFFVGAFLLSFIFSP